jgi:hypothetical protein
MSVGFDHTIFLAADPDGLDAAAARFAAAGFTLTTRPDRDRATSATAQTLVCFGDGSYVEILAIRDAAARAKHRFRSFLSKGDGWVDYSMVTDSIDFFRDRLMKAGLPVNGPFEHAREREDGRQWGVRLILAGIGAGHSALPFFLQDTIGRDLRIPPDHTRHANGATGIAGVSVAVRDLAAVALQFAVLFGEGAPSRVLPAGAAKGLRFSCGRQWIDVVELAPRSSALSDLVAERGDGLVSVTFATESGVDLCLDAASLTKNA